MYRFIGAASPSVRNCSTVVSTGYLYLAKSDSALNVLKFEKLVARGARTKTAKVRRAPYVKYVPLQTQSCRVVVVSHC